MWIDLRVIKLIRVILQERFLSGVSPLSSTPRAVRRETWTDVVAYTQLKELEKLGPKMKGIG